MSVEIKLGSSPSVHFGSGKETVFGEVSVPIGEDTIEVDISGDVRLAAIAFEAGFAGASVTFKTAVPWASADVDQEISGLTLTVQAGKVVTIPFSDMFYVPNLTLVISAVQTAAKKIGLYGWRGES